MAVHIDGQEVSPEGGFLLRRGMTLHLGKTHVNHLFSQVQDMTTITSHSLSPFPHCTSHWHHCQKSLTMPVPVVVSFCTCMAYARSKRSYAHDQLDISMNLF